MCPASENAGSRLFRCLIAAALLADEAGTHAQQQQFKARVQAAVPAASIYFELLKRFGTRIDRMTGGRLKMEILPDGAVVSAFEILDAVDKGVVEGGYAWTHYWSCGCATSSRCRSTIRQHDFYPEFVRATQATVVVPYWTKIVDLYSGLGNAALQKK